MLAPDPITIRIGREAVTLRPTLRAALRLHRKHGLPAVFCGVMEGHTAIIADILVEATGDQNLAHFLAKDIAGNGARRVLELRDTLAAYLEQLVASHEPAIAPAASKSTKPAKAATITREQHLVGLFEFATGSLGWTPDAAWQASPVEIQAARIGRDNLLKSIFGSGEPDKPKPQGNLAQQANAAMAALGARKVKQGEAA